MLEEIRSKQETAPDMESILTAPPKAETDQLTSILEALLFASGDPASKEQLATAMELEVKQVEFLAEKLKRDLAARGSSLTIRKAAGGYQMVTRPEYFHTIERLVQVKDRKITGPTMAVLTIIAFKQPITKQEIEQLRGGGRAERALQKLLELELVEEKGRKQALGRPILYGTTDLFLSTFGLESLDDLPALPTPQDAAIGMEEEQLKLIGLDVTS